MTTHDPAADFLSTDAAALASHMSTCAIRRSRFFGVHAAIELAHGLIFPRLLTVVMISVLLLVAISIV